MRLAFVADVHVANHPIQGGPMISGVNQRAQAILDALHQAVREAAQLDCEFVILGDLFDTAKPTPQLVAATMAALRISESPDLQPQVLIMKGNHDEQSSARGDHALGPLAVHPESGVELFEEPRIVTLPGGELWMVPFQTGPAKEWLPVVMAGLESTSSFVQGERVLALHLGIHDGDLRSANFWAEGAHDAIGVEQLVELCFKHRINGVYAGNWHARREWTVTDQGHTVRILQVGTLAPTGWDNPGLEGYGTVAHWLDGHMGAIEVPGPRFVNVRSQAELDDITLEAGVHNRLWVRRIAEPNDLDNARFEVEAIKHSSPTVMSAEVRVSKESIKAAAAQAATAARASGTLMDALEAYVAKLELPAGIDRAWVIEKARTYLEVSG